MNTELKQFLDNHIKNDTDTDKITVLPLPCGIGKSQYIQYLLSDALINNYGLIVVTDTINRLNKYVTTSYDDESEILINYIQRNKDKISILTADTFRDEIKKTNYKPIILMSTQRYFGLTKDDIIRFTTGQQYKRTKIIFDEKISLLESRTITIPVLNNIDNALRCGLDNTIDQADKAALINDYERFNDQLQAALIENERANIDNADYKRECYFDGKIKDIDLDKFYGLIDKYKQQLYRYNPEVLKDIYALKKLLFDGVITSQKTKSKNNSEFQKYNNYFTVVTNNADKLINIGAKVFVLDGTADISPEYRLKCIQMVNCSRFKRDLSKLTINIVNVNTSKDRLLKNDEKTNKLIQTIIDYIKALPLNIDTVFTYQAIENEFIKDFANVAHLGDIKGRNDFRIVNNICQVGLNRMSELLYYLYANEIGMFNDTDKALIKRIYDKTTIDEIRCKMILADIEQNIFRSKIRNNDNKEVCTYTLFFNTIEPNKLIDGNYKPLVDMIKSRYEPLGAVVNVIDTPIEFKLFKADIRKTKEETTLQKFNKWRNNQHNRRFKRKDIMTECNLTESQFKELKKTGVLDDFKTDKQGIYIIK